MVISSNHNLIPYPVHSYQVQPFDPENTAVNLIPGQDTIDRNNLLRQPRPETTPRINPFESSASSYDATKCLAYCDADHIGRMLSIYA